MPVQLKLVAVLVALFVLIAAAWLVCFKLGLLKQAKASEEPYSCCDHILSPAEFKLYTALVSALPILCQRANRPNTPVLLAKVRLGDILTTDRERAPERAGKDGWQSARNRIDRKHVDFLLCRPSDTRPILVIELDDKSHERADRHERDAFLDRACGAAELPVLHITCLPPKVAYDPRQLAVQIAEKLGV